MSPIKPISILVRVVVPVLLVGRVTVAEAQTSTPQTPDVRAALQSLRLELDALREEYGARLTAIETKIATIEKGGAAAPAASPLPVPPLPAPPPPTPLYATND